MSIVLVTGASGLIGRAVARALFQAGHEVRGTSRDPGMLKSDPSLAATFRWPLEGAAAIDGARAVFHFVGENVGNAPWSAARKKAIESSRIDGTRQLVEAIGSLSPERRPAVLVSASAVGYYGETTRDVAEDAPHGSGFLAELCARWEAEAQKAEAHGVRVVTPRLGIVLSRQGGALEKIVPLFRFGLGGKLGSGQQKWPVVHLDDVVGLLRLAMDDERVRGPLNVSMPRPVAQADFARTLGAVLHRPAFLPAPAFALKAALGEFSAELLETRSVVPEKALALGYRFVFPELEPALRDLVGR
jgi:uncharacterized protein (TIGR01777 family)